MNAQILSTESKRVLAAAPANLPVIGSAQTSPPAVTQILAGIREDVARLSRILCHLDCDAAIRTIDGITLLAIAESRAALMAAGPALCASIYDAQGRLCATLDLITREIDCSETLPKLLVALIEAAARAISERLFRMTYRDYWIVAAQPHGVATAAMLLAVDADRRLAGADRSARQFLEAKGCSFQVRSSLAAVFEVDAAPFRESESDAALRLLGCNDGVPYSVLITPPDRSPQRSHHDERALLHARPRLDTLRGVGIKASREEESAGLAPRLLRRTQQYINTHLDSALNIEELAASAGLSVSHFSRSFARAAGTTPHNYVVRRRVLRAQQLLAETDLELSEIALTTGFADQSHFSRRFRQFVGLPPKAFRQRHR